MKKRRCPAIQLCPYCGRLQVQHPMGRTYDCPVPRTVTVALRVFATENGIRWKTKLIKAWGDGAVLSEELLKARELIGPLRLYKLDIFMRRVK